MGALSETLSWYFGAACWAILAIVVVAAIGYVPNHNGIWVKEAAPPPQIETEGRITAIISHCTFKYTPASGRLPNYPSAPCDGGASQLARSYPPGSFDEVKRHHLAQVEFRTQSGALKTVTVRPEKLNIGLGAKIDDRVSLAYNARNPNRVEKPAAKGLSLLGNQLVLLAALAICALGAFRFVWRVGFG